MTQTELVNTINDLLIKSGFKKKGNYWLYRKEEVTKMIHLQKSAHSTSFYINYGYILNHLPLENEVMHIYNRLTSINEQERNKIFTLLDLSNSISDEVRSEELLKELESKILFEMKDINTEQDVFSYLKKRSSINDISLNVKKYFNIQKYSNK